MATNSKMDLPRFELNKNKYDFDTYIGRTRNFFEIFNPMLLFTTDAQLNECKNLLNSFKSGKISSSEIDNNLNNKLWESQTIINAIIHPQTDEKIALPFRMSGFVPMNLPIACGMLLSKSVSAGLFWQWYNQSYNVCVNYSNGNKSNQLSNIKILQAYSYAVFASCSVSYGLNKLLTASQTSFSSSTYYLLSKTIPFTAVASAGALNVILMRYNEMKHGIDIMDENGNIIGKSKIAGKYAIGQTAFSRVVLPAPILLFPPFVMKGLESFSFIKNNPKIHLGTNLGVMTFFLWFALPCACGLFPQKSKINVNKLEKEYHDLPIKSVFYNRGL